MPPTDRCEDSYLDPYRRALLSFGAGFEATLWSSREGQHLRFDVMLDMAPFQGAAVLDLGCGAGDFAAYMIERRIGFRRYIGVDALPAQIVGARARALPNCEFIAGDFIADPAVLAGLDADIACMSGSLNTMQQDVARTVILNAWRQARRGVVFNFLSDRTRAHLLRTDLSPAVRFDTVSMVDWALSLSPRIRFRQDYLDGHDATIAIERDSDSGSVSPSVRCES